jgi:hypothetical protein
MVAAVWSHGGCHGLHGQPANSHRQHAYTHRRVRLHEGGVVTAEVAVRDGPIGLVEKGVRLAQKTQVGPCIPVETQR